MFHLSQFLPSGHIFDNQSCLVPSGSVRVDLSPEDPFASNWFCAAFGHFTSLVKFRRRILGVVLKIPVILESYSERAERERVRRNILSLRLVGPNDSKGAHKRSLSSSEQDRTVVGILKYC